MAENKKTRIPIGRFSKMTRLSVKALRLYDDQGLLQPAHTDSSSGYRYYHLEQAHRAEIIRVLRSIDMPLADIREIVESANDEVLGTQLQIHKRRLVERLAAQETALAYLETMIHSKAVVPSCEILLAEQPAQQVAAVKFHTSIGKITGDIQAGFVTLMHGLGRFEVTPTAAPMIVYHNVIDQESEGDVEIAVPVSSAALTGFTDEAEIYGRELEAGTMATTVYRGRYEGVARAYHAITQWVSENGYDIVGPTREIYVNDPRTVAPDELLTRLEFPVCLETSEIG